MDIYTPDFDVTLKYLHQEMEKPDTSEECKKHWSDLIAMIENPSLNEYGQFSQISPDGSNVCSIMCCVLLLAPGYEYPEGFLDRYNLLVRMQSEDQTQTMDVFYHKDSLTHENAEAQLQPVLQRLAASGAIV